MPRCISRMTDSHRQLCGCESCIISKNFVLVLNKFCTWAHKAMIDEANKHENADNKAQLEEEAKAFLGWFKKEDGSPRFSHPRDVIDAMTCPMVKAGYDTKEDTRKLYKLKCCMGRCNDRPDQVGLDIPVQLLDKSPEARTISFEEYEYHGFCSEHKSIPNAPQECPKCQEIKQIEYKDDEEKPPTGKYHRNKRLTRTEAKIGDFMLEHFLPQMRLYKWHLSLYIVLGKNFCRREWEEAIARVPGSMMEDKDFLLRPSSVFSMERYRAVTLEEGTPMSPLKGLPSSMLMKNMQPLSS